MLASQQPKDGDTILHCGHINAEQHHFWKCPPDTIAHNKITGTNDPVNWLVACDSCTKSAGGDPSKIAWMELSTWKGDEPIVHTSD